MHAALGQLRRLGEQAASHRPAGQASGIGAAQAPAGVAAGSSGSAQVGSSIGDEARAGVAEEQALEQALERKLRALELDEELARLKQQVAREG